MNGFVTTILIIIFRSSEIFYEFKEYYIGSLAQENWLGRKY